MSRKIDLVVIDPQNSFCKIVPSDQQQVVHDGELCVPGAWEDMERVANLIHRLSDKLYEIHVTLDSHHPYHIAHPAYFRNVASGSPPNPFTLMREENGHIIGTQFDSNGNPNDVGEFTTAIRSAFQETLDYLIALKNGGRYPHCIWPPHCLIGTPGHNVVSPLMSALHAWEVNHVGAIVDFVTKGSNYRREHFSAVKAEVIDSEDDTTALNTDFINTVMMADEILLAGEALSHCLANTVRDMANSFKDDSFIKKCVLLIDGSSNVPGFENYGKDFVNEMTSRGMKTANCADYLA